MIHAVKLKLIPFFIVKNIIKSKSDNLKEALIKGEDNRGLALLINPCLNSSLVN